MSRTADFDRQSHAAPGASASSALRARMRGPGGYYNIGNVLGLATGIGLQLAAMPGSGDASVRAALRQYFIGSPGRSP